MRGFHYNTREKVKKWEAKVELRKKASHADSCAMLQFLRDYFPAKRSGRECIARHIAKKVHETKGKEA